MRKPAPVCLLNCVHDTNLGIQIPCKYFIIIRLLFITLKRREISVNMCTFAGWVCHALTTTICCNQCTSLCTCTCMCVCLCGMASRAANSHRAWRHWPFIHPAGTIAFSTHTVAHTRAWTSTACTVCWLSRYVTAVSQRWFSKHTHASAQPCTSMHSWRAALSV